MGTVIAYVALILLCVACAAAIWLLGVAVLDMRQTLRSIVRQQSLIRIELACAAKREKDRDLPPDQRPDTPRPYMAGGGPDYPPHEPY